MPAHSIGSGTISFGLVAIPIKLYTAAVSAGVSFHLLHATCGHRIRQQTYSLGPDRGGAKAYRLLAQAMATTGRVALATFVLRGKERLVLIRPAPRGLLLHTLYFADEVRDVGEIDTGETAQLKEGELELAVRLIDELSHAEFTPAQYRDEYRRRVLDLVTLKGEGKAMTAVGPEVPRIRVIDLMDALKESLARRTAPAATPGALPAPLPKKPPVKVGTRAPAATPGRLEKRPPASKQ